MRFSALAAAERESGTGWFIAPSPIAAALNWGRTAPSHAAWSPALIGGPGSGSRSATSRLSCSDDQLVFVTALLNPVYVIPQCSVSCGVGQQRREVSCVSMEDSSVMQNSLCEKISKPETLRKCNLQECQRNTGQSTPPLWFVGRYCLFLGLFVFLWRACGLEQVLFAEETSYPLASVTSWSCWVAAPSGRSKDSVVSPAGRRHTQGPFTLRLRRLTVCRNKPKQITTRLLTEFKYSAEEIVEC